MRASRLLVSIVAISSLLAAEHRAVAESRRPLRHVRAIDPDLRSLLSLGYEQSPTFRALIDALDASDVIVYVEREHKRRRGVAGAMRFVTRAGGHRYLRITLYELRLTHTATALLGHELQHAAEIAAAPWVVDQETCATLYREIGHSSSCRGSDECFDTARAVDTGYQVLRELQVSAD